MDRLERGRKDVFDELARVLRQMLIAHVSMLAKARAKGKLVPASGGLYNQRNIRVFADGQASIRHCSSGEIPGWKPMAL